MSTAALEHRYAPRGVCRDLLEDRRDEILLSGPAGTGKSRACLEKVHLLALINPGLKALIVRKTLASLGTTALETWRKHVAVEAIAAGDVTWYGGSQQEAAHYRYSNGSKVYVGGMDKATKVMSSEYDVIYVQEAIELTEADWEALTTRLRNGRISFQQVIGDTNPDTPTHWLKARCDRGQAVMLESRHEDNPLLFDDDGQATDAGASYLARLDGLTGPRHARLRRGLWVAAEGQIYEEWDPVVHLIDKRWVLPKEWTRWWSIDFGHTNPLVCQWWAEDPDGRLIMYREIYMSRRLVEDHAKTMLAQVTDGNGTWKEPKPRGIVCDHDAEGRATLERYLGMSTIPAIKNVTDGIQAVQARLRPAADGKPRLMIMRDALVQRDAELAEAKKPTCTAEEFAGYVWARPLDGRPIKEDPVKVDDHGMDALRYCVTNIDRGVRPRIRVL